MHKASQSKQFLITAVVAVIAAIFSSAITYVVVSSQRGGQSPVPNQQTIPTIQVSSTQQASETTTSVSEATKNWKTYTSEDVTFSFKYLANWIYEVTQTTLDIRGKNYTTQYLEAGEPLTKERRKMADANIAIMHQILSTFKFSDT